MNYISRIRTNIGICAKSGACAKLIIIAGSILVGVAVLYLTSTKLFGYVNVYVKLSELAPIRLRVFAALGASIIFAVSLQLFTLKAAGDRRRLNEAGVTANQAIRQISFTWYLMLINIISASFLFLFVAYNYLILIASKAPIWRLSPTPELELAQNVVLGFSSASLFASIFCALVDIRIVYLEGFSAERNNDNG